MRPLLIWTGVVSAIAVASWSAHRAAQAHDSEAASASATAAELRALRESIDQMKDQLRALRVQLHMRDAELATLTAVAPTQAADHVDEPAPADTPSRAEPTVARSPLEQTQQFVEHVDAVLAQQSRDAAWREASDLPLKLKGILPPGSQVESVRCGTTLCRVETRHRSLDAYRDFVGGIAVRPKTSGEVVQQFWSGASAFLRLGEAEGSEGEVHAVAYLARENASLPEP